MRSRYDGVIAEEPMITASFQRRSSNANRSKSFRKRSVYSQGDVAKQVPSIEKELSKNASIQSGYQETIRGGYRGDVGSVTAIEEGARQSVILNIDKFRGQTIVTISQAQDCLDVLPTRFLIPQPANIARGIMMKIVTGRHHTQTTNSDKA
jgi:hypothetical protein